MNVLLLRFIETNVYWLSLIDVTKVIPNNKTRDLSPVDNIVILIQASHWSVDIKHWLLIGPV